MKRGIAAKVKSSIVESTNDDDNWTIEYPNLKKNLKYLKKIYSRTNNNKEDEENDKEINHRFNFGNFIVRFL